MIIRNVKYASKLEKKQNVYIGGGNDQRKRSPLYCPFYLDHRHASKEETQAWLDRYKEYLWKKMKSSDPKVSGPIWAELRKLSANSILLCHCYPYHRCHGEIVRLVWNWAYSKGYVGPMYVCEHEAKTLANAAVSNRTELYGKEQHGIAELIERARGTVIEVEKEEHIARSPEEQRRDDDLKYGPGVTRQQYMDRVAAIESRALRTTIPAPRRGRGAPRKPRGIVYLQPDTRYNLIDDIQADLEELTTAYRWTESVWPTVTAGAAYLSHA